MFVSCAQLVMGMLHSELLHGRVSMPGASAGMSEAAGSLAWQQHAIGVRACAPACVYFAWRELECGRPLAPLTHQRPHCLPPRCVSP